MYEKINKFEILCKKLFERIQTLNTCKKLLIELIRGQLESQIGIFMKIYTDDRTFLLNYKFE